MNVRRLLLFVLLPLLTLAAQAQAQRVNEPAPRIVMNLAAHPDDEDGLTLAYYRHAQDAVAHSLIYTRGEGGQNEIGPELYEALGAIRTEETERAARHLGTQVRFLNFYDFGFSKFAHEAFEEWGGRDAVTARLVYLIRKLKPDVLFTNHDTLTVGPRRQHGQHQAVGLSAYDALALAADPSYHPEQLAEPGVDLWQPQRLFLRIRRDTEQADVKVPVGDAIPGAESSAADLAVDAAAEHRSQGFDKLAPRFRADTTYFVLLRAADGAPPLPEDATDLAAGLPPNPHAAEQALAYWIDSGRAPAFPGGALTTSDTLAVPGQRVALRWPAAEDDGLRLVLSGAVDTSFAARDGEATLPIPPDAAPTLPKERAQYGRFVSSPPVQYALRHPDGSLVYAGHLPLEIAPPLALAVDEQPLLLRPGTNRLRVTGQLYDPGADSLRLVVTVVQPDPLQPLIEHDVYVAAGPEGAVDAPVSFALPEDVAAGPYAVSVLGATPPTTASPEGGRDLLRIEGRVLPDVAVPEGLRVGFVRSYDDTTEEALRQMGAEVVPLDSAALAAGAFDGLHTIVIDIRAYLVRPDLRRHNDRLLAWVRDGGHLVVNYHKTFEWNPGQTSGDFFDEVVEVPDEGFAPYPLVLGRDRVTYEDAPVTLLQPEHPLFHRPNEIAAADWEGWVQERGLYFPADYDDRYVELFEMADPGEDPLPSSTLVAEVGAGTYVYTALGWYRQLARYHPGAYRLYANLVSLPLVDGRAHASHGG